LIGLVTDSNAQLPAGLRDRYAFSVVPLTIVIDGIAYKEGVDLDADACYDALERTATVSTASPSPGEVLRAYEAMARAGVDGIVSVHVGSNASGTLNAVKLAADDSPVPVEIVDTGTASFAIGCCVWAAGDALAAGADAQTAADVARAVATRVGNVFVVGGLEPARRGGRLSPDVADGGDVPVLALVAGVMRQLGSVDSVDSAVTAMADHVGAHALGGEVRVGVGDARAEDAASALTARLGEVPGVAEVVRYQVGPSVVVHTGLGTVGACYFPAR
jgi:fatty acid kinase fatty acid binding subunit